MQHHQMTGTLKGKVQPSALGIGSDVLLRSSTVAVVIGLLSGDSPQARRLPSLSTWAMQRAANGNPRSQGLCRIGLPLRESGNPLGPDLQKLTCPRVGTHALIQLLTLLRLERSTVAIIDLLPPATSS